MPAEPLSAASGLAVVYVDDAFVVLNKPSGLLSVPGRGPDKQDCLSSRVQAHFADALVVHRLDMATSGLLVMARGALAQRRLNDAFAQRTVHKRYLAWVSGPLETPGDDWREIDLPIIVDWPNRPLRVIDHQRGQASVTRVRVLQHDATRNRTLVELEPVTGRSHQLRVHLQAIGHPILGDALYAPAAEAAMAQRLQLHACNLAFPHPITGALIHFECGADF
jgi:tRNA pseudouridine32 synthase/23S rRNA pseudouridine746 synthase